MSDFIDSPIYQDLVSSNLDLDQLFLDPNNPRFISMDWDYIQDDFIADDAVQEEVMHRMIRGYSVTNLLTNMEVNGYLPIDRVIVKKFEDDKYYVLEGNRRIAAAKQLKLKIDKGDEGISEEIKRSIDSIPVLIYTGDEEEASWIFQGLRHIMGVKDWSAYNKAKLLVKLMDEEGLTLTDVGRKFGLSSFGAGQWARGYYALMQAKDESDYSKEVDERAFPFFQELFNRSNGALRDWLSWNDKDKRFDDDLKFNEFLSWLYPKDYSDYPDEEGSIDLEGDWSERKIRTAQNLRNLSYIIKNSSKEFENFKSDLELDKSYNRVVQAEYEEESKRKSDVIEDTFESLDVSLKSLNELPFTIFNDKQQLDLLLVKLNKIVEKIDEIKQFSDGKS